MRSSLSILFRRSAIIGLALLLLAGCSAMRLGYNQGPQLAHWWLDDYLDFNDAQSARVRHALGLWFAWHRETQLADYAALLARARSDLDGPLTAAQVCAWSDQVRTRLDPALERALPLAAEVAATLNTAQLAHLERRYAKANAKARKEMLQSDPAERLAASVDRAVERFETFYGPLDDTQRRVVGAAVAASPFDAAVWIAEREQRQRELLAVLRRIDAERPDAATTQAMLRAMARRFDGSLQPGTQAAQLRLAQYNCDLVARVHATASPAQRRHVRDKLGGWETDFRQLAAQALPAPDQASALPGLRR